MHKSKAKVLDERTLKLSKPLKCNSSDAIHIILPLSMAAVEQTVVKKQVPELFY